MKEKILNIKGGEFKEWYSSLSSNEKNEYKRTIERMKESDSGNGLISPILYSIDLVLESEDDYEGVYAVENRLKKYLEK